MKNRTSLVFLFLMFFQFGSLVHASTCAKDLLKYVQDKGFTESILGNLNNAELFQIRYILNKVTNDPKIGLTSQDMAAIQKFHLDHGVNLAREEGLKRLALQQKVDRNDLALKLALQGGTASVLALTFYAKFIDTEAKEDDLNDKFDLHLKDNQTDDIQFFWDALHCNPKLSDSLDRIDQFKNKYATSSVTDDDEEDKVTYPEFTIVDLLHGERHLFGQFENIMSIYTNSFIKNSGEIYSVKNEIAQLEYTNKNFAEFSANFAQTYDQRKHNYVEKEKRLAKIKNPSRNIKSMISNIKEQISNLQKEYNFHATPKKRKSNIKTSLRNAKNKLKIVGQFNENTISYLKLKHMWKNVGVSICSNRLASTEFKINSSTIDTLFQFLARVSPEHRDRLRSSLNDIFILDSSKGDLPLFIDSETRYFSNYRARMKKVDLFLPRNAQESKEEQKGEISEFLTKSLVDILLKDISSSIITKWKKMTYTTVSTEIGYVPRSNLWLPYSADNEYRKEFEKASNCYFSPSCRSEFSSNSPKLYSYLHEYFKFDSSSTNNEISEPIFEEYNTILAKYLKGSYAPFITTEMKERGGASNAK